MWTALLNGVVAAWTVTKRIPLKKVMSRSEIPAVPSTLPPTAAMTVQDTTITATLVARTMRGREDPGPTGEGGASRAGGCRGSVRQKLIGLDGSNPSEGNLNTPTYKVGASLGNCVEEQISGQLPDHARTSSAAPLPQGRKRCIIKELYQARIGP